MVLRAGGGVGACVWGVLNFWGGGCSERVRYGDITERCAVWRIGAQRQGNERFWPLQRQFCSTKIDTTNALPRRPLFHVIFRVFYSVLAPFWMLFQGLGAPAAPIPVHVIPVAHVAALSLAASIIFRICIHSQHLELPFESKLLKSAAANSNVNEKGPLFAHRKNMLLHRAFLSLGNLHSLRYLNSLRQLPSLHPSIPLRTYTRYLTCYSHPNRQYVTRQEAPASVPLAAVTVTTTQTTGAFIQKADAAQELGFAVRDLRAVDPSFRSHAPAILPRQNGIIMHLADIRVIILHDSVLVFDPVNPSVEAFIPQLQARLASPYHPMPFEFRAVEAVLVELCSQFNATIGALIPSLDLVLDTLSTTTDFGGSTVQNCMDRLLPMENALNEFSSKVSATRAALNEILVSDEDMSLMYLSTYQQTGHRRRIDQHDEMEMMLENYVKQVDTVYSEVSSALKAIKATEHATQIRLDAMRNRVLRLDIFLNLGAVSVGVGGLVAGFFGMNLESGYEEHPHTFWLVSAMATMASVLFFRGTLAYLRLRRYFQ